MRFVAMTALMTASILGLAACTAPLRSAEDPRGPRTEYAGSAATLWRRTCMGCHTLRSPDTYSDYDWDIVIMHMRIHAYLTQEDAEVIGDFLKSAN
jgi:hypothetical protein